MKKWESEIYRNEYAQPLKTEYRKLLAAGVSESEAEKLCFDYAMENAVPGSWEEGRIWLALALQEWELGRLSKHTKVQALVWLHAPNAPYSKNALIQLEQKLMSPQPPAKKIRRPSWVKKCPYSAGSLLAYRMISCSDLKDTAYWGKVVLLRVLKIKKNPVSFLAPEACCNESMLVGLYDWIGDSIPDPGIVNQLDFTYIEAPAEESAVYSIITEQFSETLPEPLNKQLRHHFINQKPETCCNLSWSCVKGIDPKQVFMLLDCDPYFDYSSLPFFDFSATSYSLAHSIPFDLMLKNRFGQFNHRNTISP